MHSLTLCAIKIGLKELIQKHKDDIETTEKLFDYTYVETKGIATELLTWIQDMN